MFATVKAAGGVAEGQKDERICKKHIHVEKSWCDGDRMSESEERKVEGERIKLQPV